MTDNSDQLFTEQQLIATLLLKPDNLYKYTIEPEELEHLGYYLKAIKDVFQRTGKTSPMAVVDAVITEYPDKDPKVFRDNIVELLGMPYIEPDAGTAVNYLKNAHQVRKILTVCQSITQKAMQNGVKFEDLYALMNQESSDVGRAASYQAQQDVLQDWISQQKNNTATPTGFHLLDKALEGGLQDGNVYGLAGYAKAGKTLLAGTISGNMARLGIPHLYVAMEMGAGAIESRTIAKNLGITNRSLKNQIKLGRSPITADMAHNTTFYLNAPGISWKELRQQMVIALHKDGIKRFIIDYWQLLSNDTRKDDHQYWADAAQGISDFCKKYGAACILVAQLNDDGKTFGSRGLVKACDMLFNIEICENDNTRRWLKMKATRETEQADLGSDNNPYLEINPLGPYMQELQQ